MTTFQATVFAVIHALSEFLPIGSKTQHILIPYLLGWQPPSGLFLGALSLGSFLALLIYFRHDWASMISCFLQVIIFRKRPMTLDERLPLFIGVSTLPFAVVSYYFQDRILELNWTPVMVALIFACMSLPLWAMDFLNRKTKGMFDWSWVDASVVGFVEATTLIPGWDHFTAVLAAALLLNYRKDAAVKYAYFLSGPILATQAIRNLRGLSFSSASPMPDLSWLSFVVGMIVALFVGLVAIGGFMKQIQQKGFAQYVVYRFLVATSAIALFWFKNR